MPIREISERPRIPIKGIIRLGIREEARSGNTYPKTVEYFVLDDAPEVKKVYGEDPRELDIAFPGNNIEAVIPTWYKYWTASLRKGNEIREGRLLCMGNGSLDGNPGEATWYDRERIPNGAVYAPDPISGDPVAVAPNNTLRNPLNGYFKRPCMGRECPDAFDAKGNRVCKQSMQIFCILPLVSFGDVYVINTSSWESIRSFHSLLTWHATAYGPDFIVNNYYKVIREETATRYYDKKEQREKDSKQYIMVLTHQDKEDFEKTHFERLKSRKALINAGSMMRYLPSHEEAAHIPMDELYPLIEAGPVIDTPKEMTTDEKIAHLIADPDIIKAFAILEELTGASYSTRARGKAIFKKIGDTDPKAAVLNELNNKIDKVTADKLAKLESNIKDTTEQIMNSTVEPPAEVQVINETFVSQQPIEHIDVTVELPKPEPSMM